MLGRCQHDNVVRLLAASINPKQLCLVGTPGTNGVRVAFHSSKPRAG